MVILAGIRIRIWGPRSLEPLLRFFNILLEQFRYVQCDHNHKQIMVEIYHSFDCMHRVLGFRGSGAPGRILRSYSMSNHTSSFSAHFERFIFLSKFPMFRKQYLRSWSKRVRAEMACKMVGMACKRMT